MRLTENKNTLDAITDRNIVDMEFLRLDRLYDINRVWTSYIFKLTTTFFGKESESVAKKLKAGFASIHFFTHGRKNVCDNRHNFEVMSSQCFGETLEIVFQTPANTFFGVVTDAKKLAAEVSSKRFVFEDSGIDDDTYFYLYAIAL